MTNGGRDRAGMTDRVGLFYDRHPGAVLAGIHNFFHIGIASGMKAAGSPIKTLGDDERHIRPTRSLRLRRSPVCVFCYSPPINGSSQTGCGFSASHIRTRISVRSFSGAVRRISLK